MLTWVQGQLPATLRKLISGHVSVTCCTSRSCKHFAIDCVVAAPQAAAQLDKLRGSHKRKLSELQTSLQGKLTEADQKLTKLNSKAGKAQGLGGMLKQFMAAAQ